MVGLLLTLAAPALAKDISVPTLGLVVQVPDPEPGVSEWNYTLGDVSTDVKLSMRNAPRFTDVQFLSTGFQPALEAIGPNLVEWFARVQDDDELDFRPGDWTTETFEGLGEVVLLPIQVRDNFLERDLWSHVAAFPLEGAAAIVTATTSVDAERADEVLREVLSMLRITRPPVPPDQLPVGEVEAPAGYRLTLPDGWRALTEEEARHRSTARVGGSSARSGAWANLFVVDTSTLDRDVFTCTAAADGTLEILDPAKDPRAGENFRTFARVRLKGGQYRIATGTEESFVEVIPERPVHPEGEGELSFIRLADREAYYFQTDGLLFNEPVRAGVFYTAWDDVGLTCIAVEDDDTPGLLGTFRQVMEGLEVVDGAEHPMPLTLRSAYIRWWPWTHPLLQLYWLPLPLFLVAGWLIVRD